MKLDLLLNVRIGIYTYIVYTNYLIYGNTPISDAPVCKKQRKEAFGVARQELVSVRCDVLSDPMENLKFEWIFSKGDEKLDMQQSQIR